jgi:hypothetical protein
MLLPFGNALATPRLAADTMTTGILEFIHVAHMQISSNRRGRTQDRPSHGCSNFPCLLAPICDFRWCFRPFTAFLEARETAKLPK